VEGVAAGCMDAAASASAAAPAASADAKVLYSCRTVVMKFRDPTLPHQLSKILKVSRAISYADP
jgi:hypothetical protein